LGSKGGGLEAGSRRPGPIEVGIRGSAHLKHRKWQGTEKQKLDAGDTQEGGDGTKMKTPPETEDLERKRAGSQCSRHLVKGREYARKRVHAETQNC